MGLTLIIGRANAGKSGAITRHVAAGVAAGRETLLLLPGHAEVRRAREEMASAVPLGLTVTTFDQWLEASWARFGDGRRLVSSGSREAFVLELVDAADGSLGAVAGAPGLARLVVDLVARTAGFDRSSGRSATVRALSEMISRYDALLAEASMVEPGEALRLLGQSAAFSGLTVALNRFTQLSPAQLRAIQELSDGSEVMIALTWEKGFSATEALSEPVEVLAQIATSIQEPDTTAPSSELERLEAQLFAPLTPLSPRGSVVLSEAAGAEAEAVVVADAVERAILEGIEPGRIAVVARDMAPRAHLIETALRSRGISHAIDIRSELRSTPLGRALAALLSVVGGRGGRVEALHFLRSPFSGASRGAVDALDVQWRRQRVNESLQLLRDSSRLSSTVARLVESARAALHTETSPTGLQEWQNLAYLLLGSSLENPTRRGKDADLDVAAYSSIVRLVGDFSTSGLVVAGERFARVLLRSTVSPGSREDTGSVQVTEAHRLRSRRFDVVIVAGLTASEFSAEGSEPLIASVLREMKCPSGVEEHLSERILFYMIVTRARHRVELVRQFADAAGGVLRPSVFWEEVLDLYRTAEQAATGEQGALGVQHRVYLSELETAAPSFRTKRRDLRAAAASGPRGSLQTRRGVIGDSTLLWPDDDEFSVTEIEDYMACPYRWLYGRVIRPSEVDAQFEARERGSYAHALLAAFYEHWRATGRTRVTSQQIPVALRLLDEVSGLPESDVSHRTKGLSEELAATGARGWVRKSIEQDAVILEQFAPVANEWRFGKRASRPFVFGGVGLRGTIDRIDEGPAGVIVTDYKSTSSIKGQAGFVSGGLLQATIYAQAAAEAFESAAVAGFYRSLPTGEMRGFWDSERAEPELFVAKGDRVDREGFRDLVAATREAVAQAVEGIRAGRIGAAPSGKGACEYCGAKPFCSEART